MSPLCLLLTTVYLFLSIQEEIEESKDYEVEEVVEEDNWEPDERAITDPEGFRINTWVNTLLGTEKEQERERDDWDPDEQAISNPEGFRINTWKNTLQEREIEKE